MALANYNQAVTLGFPSQKLTDLQREWNNKLRQEEEKRKQREAEEARKRADEKERQRKEAKEARQKAEEERKQREAEAKFPQLAQFLAKGEWRKADEETRRVMLKFMGRESKGWLTHDDCKNFPREELKIIDALWVKHSNGRFGFSVQKKIFVEQCGGTPGEYNYDAWCKLLNTVGWKDRDLWLYYESYTFNTNALHGHLPSSWRLVANNDSKRRGGVNMWSESALEFEPLFSRLNSNI